MEYKLIVVDMDGTLLNSKHEISLENKKTLKEAIDKGIYIAIATGRIYTSARFYGKLLGIATPIIACNGGLIRDLYTNEIIYHNPMTKEDVIAIAEICKAHDIYFHFYDQEVFYIEELKHSSLRYHQWNLLQKEEDRINIVHLQDAIRFLKNTDIDVLKVLIIDEDSNKLERVKKIIAQMNSIQIDKSWHNNIEIMNKDVSKGKAIEALAKKLGIKKNEIIAFGDNYNDLSMKDYVETFVAMGNGEDYVLQQSDYITAANDEDGVAEGIKRIVFQEA
ncbi:hypothetical protein SAMN05660297_02013 [Natronincola peptidivorans]|uniref:Cof subfamily of IIB subfamily of haloacid dehalogenase superfamily/HAD-superfamily hydrolase, subfamily IIB n=1 Tax=Natronincola peptidivorans TaxID=426128 RepID=A0A1I0DJ15_9FIRM|nr:Cof-type HAD-IIB family hydrolase [Natronincola peptidivorans]SET32426.1 hypothetical protein SAMN05660297_02013 [Natronincola peptidivorans]